MKDLQSRFIADMQDKMVHEEEHLLDPIKTKEDVLLDIPNLKPSKVADLPPVLYTFTKEGVRQFSEEYTGILDASRLHYPNETLPKSLETDPTGKSPNEPGAKVDAGKNRGWLFFKGYARALKAVSEVTTEGAKKYTPNGWKTVENGEERYMDAFMRHLFDVAMDKKYDDGAGGIGTLHMAQVIWNLLSVLELQLQEEEPANGK